MPKTWPSPIFKKNSFPSENAGNMPEIAVFADFQWTFSGTADCRAGKTDFLQFLESYSKFHS